MTNGQNEEGHALAKMVQDGLAIVRVENETIQRLAIERPRNEDEVLKKALKELERMPEFAASTFYVIPRMNYSTDPPTEVKITGLGIRATEQIGRLWGNLAWVGRPVGTTQDGKIQVQGAARDFETNFSNMAEIEVPTSRYNKKTKQIEPLKPTELVLAINAGISKAKRNALLGILPVFVKETYFRRAKELAGFGEAPKAVKQETAAQQKARAQKQLLEAVDRMLKVFEGLGATKDQVFARLKVKKTVDITAEQLGEMAGIRNAIVEKETTLAEVFGGAEPQAAESGAETFVQELFQNGGEKGEKLTDEQRQNGLVIAAMVKSAKSKASLEKMALRVSDDFANGKLTKGQAGQLSEKINARTAEVK